MFDLFAPTHIIIVGVIAILLFGDRLPEVMRSFGKGMSEFKKGMQGIQSSMNTNLDSNLPRSGVAYKDDRDEPSAPRFQPPTSEPRAEHDSHEAEDHGLDEHSSEHSPAEHSSTEQAGADHLSQPSAAQHSP